MPDRKEKVNGKQKSEKKKKGLLCSALCAHVSTFLRLNAQDILKLFSRPEKKLPVARKRCVASSSWGETFTFISLSESLKMEKSCCFLSWWDTRRFVRLSATKTQKCTEENVFLSDCLGVDRNLELEFFYWTKPYIEPKKDSWFPKWRESTYYNKV